MGMVFSHKDRSPKNGHSFALKSPREHPISEHLNTEHPIPEHPNSERASVRTLPRGIFKVAPFDFQMGIGVTPTLLGTPKWETKQACPLVYEPARRKASGPERMVLWVSP